MTIPSIWQLGSLSSGDISAKIDIFDSNDPAVIGKHFLDSRFGCLWLKIHHGTSIEHKADTAAWISAFRKASQGKVKVGGWGVLEIDPVGEARLASSLIADYNLDAYIADAEGPHKADWPSGDISRTRAFCEKFRELRPRPFQLGWSSFAASFAPYKLGDTQDLPPRFSGPLDFRSPFLHGARWIPQVYPNESGLVYEMGVTIDHANRSHWPLNLVHPWLGCWDSAHPYDPRAYVAEMRAMKIIGFNVFRIEMMSHSDWDILNAAIGVGGVALPRS